MSDLINPQMTTAYQPITRQASVNIPNQPSLTQMQSPSPNIEPPPTQESATQTQQYTNFSQASPQPSVSDQYREIFGSYFNSNPQNGVQQGQDYSTQAQPALTTPIQTTQQSESHQITAIPQSQAMHLAVSPTTTAAAAPSNQQPTTAATSMYFQPQGQALHVPASQVAPTAADQRSTAATVPAVTTVPAAPSPSDNAVPTYQQQPQPQVTASPIDYSIQHPVTANTSDPQQQSNANQNNHASNIQHHQHQSADPSDNQALTSDLHNLINRQNSSTVQQLKDHVMKSVNLPESSVALVSDYLDKSLHSQPGVLINEVEAAAAFNQAIYNLRQLSPTLFEDSHQPSQAINTPVSATNPHNPMLSSMQSALRGGNMDFATYKNMFNQTLASM